MYVRPDLWWNPIDGIKAGVHVEGNYLNTLRRVDASVWWNTHVLQTDKYLSTQSEGYYDKYNPVNYTFNYTTPISRRFTKVQMQLSSRLLDGMWYHKGGFNWAMNDKNMVKLTAQTMWRRTTNNLDYLIYPNEWNSMLGHHNTSINAEWTHNYRYMNGAGAYTLSFRAPYLGTNSSAFNYAWAQLEAINYHRLDKLLIRTRLFGRYGTGTNIPSESALYLAGASPEELMDNKYTRSVGMLPTDWGGYSPYDVNHFQQGGGLNLRGYAGYYALDTRDGANLIAYKGRSGASASMEVDVEDYIPLHPKFTKWLHTNLYFFGDVGIIDLSRYFMQSYWLTVPTTMMSDVRADAGIGMAFIINHWGVFEKAKPLTVRIDMPFFLSHTPYNNPQYIAARWVVGINRTF